MGQQYIIQPGDASEVQIEPPLHSREEEEVEPATVEVKTISDFLKLFGLKPPSSIKVPGQVLKIAFIIIYTVIL